MRFLNCTLGHSKRKPVLIDINCEIKKGEWAFIDGASGTGKSTLFSTIFGTLKPLGGSFIDHRGRDVYRLSGKELRAYKRTCGMVFQDHKLMPTKTVYENIAYAMEICGYGKSTIAIRTNELLTQVGMRDKSNAFPSQLSGGEAQRVALARALIHEPAVILADEPTASLDPENTLMVIDLLRKLNTLGTTVIFATHDSSLFSMIEDARVIDVEQWRV